MWIEIRDNSVYWAKALFAHCCLRLRNLLVFLVCLVPLFLKYWWEMAFQSPRLNLIRLECAMVPEKHLLLPGLPDAAGKHCQPFGLNQAKALLWNHSSQTLLQDYWVWGTINLFTSRETTSSVASSSHLTIWGDNLESLFLQPCKEVFQSFSSCIVYNSLDLPLSLWELYYH